MLDCIIIILVFVGGVSLCLSLLVLLSNNLTLLRIGEGITIVGMISFVVVGVLLCIIPRPNYTHTVTTRYEVVCDDNGNFNVSSDIELPESAVQLINEEAEYMKKWDVDSFSGAIRITYSCTDDSRIHDEACYCTESELCKYCSAHSELEKAELLR